MPDRFSERVGGLLDLAGSVTLSNMLGELGKVPFKPTGITPGAIEDAFVKERTTLVRDIVQRFVPSLGPSRNRLPSLAEFHANCMLQDGFTISRGAVTPNAAAAYAPYRKHYLTLQGRLALASHRLRMRTAKAIAGLSPMLAGLASLDQALGDALYHRQRQSLDRIPIFLEQHFNRLLLSQWQALPSRPEIGDLAPWMAPAGWISSFCGQMQALLLAELEIRLQPVVGLIESTREAGIDE